MYTFITISAIQWCYIFQVDDATHPSTGEGSRASVSSGPTTSPAATLPAAADNVESEGEGDCTSEDTLSSALDARPRRKPRKTAQTQQRSALDQVKKIFGFYLL